MPYIPVFCWNCKYIIGEYIPKLYCGIVPKIYNDEIIGNVNYEIGYLDSYFSNYECLKTTYDIIKPGKTTINLSYYINYNKAYSQGICVNCRQWNEMSEAYEWYSFDDTFNVIATVRYNLNYDSNNEKKEVSNMPLATIQNASEENLTIKVSEKIPICDGYEFLGWTDEKDQNKIKYKGGESITLKWESGGNVNKTLYAVWREIDSEAYVVRYDWSGLPQNENVKLPNDEFVWKYTQVNVNNRKAGDIVTIDEVEYEFSGWSTKDVEIVNNKFIMPGKDVTLVGKWVKKEDVKVKLYVEKIWEDGNNEALKRPDDVKVNLLKNGEIIDSILLNSENEWKYTFTDLAKYDESLNEIVYTIDEEMDSKFYIKEKVEKISDTEFVIINKFEVPDQKEEILVKKIWLDEENKYKKRPSSIILQIKNKEEIVEEAEVNETDEWSYKFEVAKYDELGNEIEYTVDEREKNEEDLKYYEKTIEGNVITNKYIYESTVDTSDINISVYGVIFFIAIIGIIVGVKFVRENKLNKKG